MLTRDVVSESRTRQRKQYEPQVFFCSQSIEFTDDEIPEGMTRLEYSSELKREVREQIKNELDEQERISILLTKQEETGDRKTLVDGIPYVHVTDFLGFKDKATIQRIPNIELHAQVGTSLDWSFKQYVSEGVLAWKEDHGLSEEWEVVYKRCFEGLSTQLTKFSQFLTFGGHSTKIVNHKYRYVGELDAWGSYNADDGKGQVPCVFDCKKTDLAKKTNKKLIEKYHQQMSCYAKGSDVFFGRTVILSPYCEPLVSDNVEENFTNAIKLRTEYRNKYGV